MTWRAPFAKAMRGRRTSKCEPDQNRPRLALQQAFEHFVPIVESSSVTTVTSLRCISPNQFVYRHVGGGRWIAAWQGIVRRTGHSPREHILEKTGVVHLLTPRMAWGVERARHLGE